MTAALAMVPLQARGTARPHFVQAPGTPSLEYYVYLPESLQAGAEPLVLVHGISRNAAELVLRFAEQADRTGVPLIAPLFRQESFGQYQQAVDPKCRIRSDLALCKVLDDAARRFGLATLSIALFGFSGGAQFAHRFSLIHPNRVRVCIPASAGWYTMPDPEQLWPLGLAGLPDGPLDPAARRVPFHLIVGQRDRHDDPALRHSPELDRIQGRDRRSRAKAWHRALRKAGWCEASSLTILPRTRHNFTSAHRQGLTQTVFRLLGYEGTNQ